MKQHKIFKTALLVFALLILLTAGLVLDSKYHLQLTEYDLSFRKLPESFDGCKVLQLSDLHGASFGPENRRLVDLIRQQEPDIIVLTGDIAGKDGALENVEPLLTGIEGLAPTYYVNGNHEWADGCVEEIEAQGKEFDPELHNAVMHIDDENLGENVIAQVFQAGFKMGDKVIRHSIVQVAN